MKILRSAVEASEMKAKREKAFRGCYACPYCSLVTYEQAGKRLVTRSDKVILPTKYVTSIFKCQKCGSVWETEPYEEDDNDHLC